MELRQLQTFLSIVKHNNFTKAAASLGYAQSTVTTQIKKLEEHFDTPLFERIGRNIHLTEHGHNLVPLAKEMCRLNDQALEIIKNDDPLSGVIRIATPESLCIKWFPYVYQSLNEHYPTIEVNLVNFDCNNYESLLHNNEVDLAFVIDTKPIPEEFVTMATWELKMNLLVSPEHQLAGLDRVPFDALNNQRMILTEDGCCYNTEMRRVIHDHKIQTKEFKAVSSVQFIRQLAMNNYGVAFLPDFATETDLKEGKLVKLPWQGSGSKFTTSLIRHRDKYVSPRIKAFTEISQLMIMS